LLPTIASRLTVKVHPPRSGSAALGRTAFIAGRGELLAELTEIESGRRNDRPQLAAALDLCCQHRAVLVIAKLDRLARNVAFIANLMESGVEFVAVDMPQANRLTCTSSPPLPSTSAR
jgi:DNA invertase Pin-like site-specific DNA recombinase